MKSKILSILATGLTVGVLTNVSIVSAAPVKPEVNSQLAQRNRPNRSKPQIPEPQQQNIDKLKSDLQAIQSKSEFTPEQKQKLAASLMTLASGTTKPSTESVQKLANDLSNALDDSNLSNQEIYQLSKDIQTVLNSANVPQQEVQTVINNAKTVLEASNLTKADVQLIIADLQAIAQQLKVNLPQSSQNATGRKQPRLQR
jgi:tRNA C32,U32 (ribose-2'-O)-methylase TrmJ